MQPGQLAPIRMIAVPRPFGIIIGPAKFERLHVFPDESRTTYD